MTLLCAFLFHYCCDEASHARGCCDPALCLLSFIRAVINSVMLHSVYCPYVHLCCDYLHDAYAPVINVVISNLVLSQKNQVCVLCYLVRNHSMYDCLCISFLPCLIGTTGFFYVTILVVNYMLFMVLC